MRKNPIEVEKKLEQSLLIHKKESARLDQLINVAESRHVDENWFFPKTIVVMSLLAFVVGTLIPI